MDEEDVFDEIRSVFKSPMQFRFTILQTSGGDSKSLMVPELSSSYKWTAAAIAGKNAKVPIYILAEDELLVGCVIIIMHESACMQGIMYTL